MVSSPAERQIMKIEENVILLKNPHFCDRREESFRIKYNVGDGQILLGFYPNSRKKNRS